MVRPASQMPTFLFAPRANSFDTEETVILMYIGVQRQNAVTVSKVELNCFLIDFESFFFMILNFRRQDFDKKSSCCILLTHNNIHVCFLITLTAKYINITGVIFLFAKLQVYSYSQIKTFGVSKISILFLFY